MNPNKLHIMLIQRVLSKNHEFLIIYNTQINRKMKFVRNLLLLDTVNKINCDLSDLGEKKYDGKNAFDYWNSNCIDSDESY